MAAVSVERGWPSTGGRLGPAQVPVSASRTLKVNFEVVDASGVPFEIVTRWPAGVPQVDAASEVPDQEGLRGRHLDGPDPAAGRRAQVSGIR